VYETADFVLETHTIYNTEGLLYKYHALLTYDGMLNIHTYDTFNIPIRNANVTLIKLPPPHHDIEKIPPITTTDGEGNCTVHVSAGDYVIRVWKNPIVTNHKVIWQSSVVDVDDEYYVVYIRAPGYCFLLGLFIRVNAVALTNIFLIAVTAISTYFLARCIFNWQIAFIATLLVLTSSVAILSAYLVGMGDYATMTLGVLGMWLFVEYVHSSEKEKIRG
jgi:hypothetical protein